VINYVNLSTARAALRAREVALRKVFGATRGALAAQFLVEAVAVSLLAALIALALVELTLPLFNTALGSALKLRYTGPDSVLPLFVAVTTAVGLTAGVYPALVLSRFQPAGVLAASKAPGGGRAAGLVREALVLVQFAVSIALLIGAGVVFAQSEFVRRADLGFQRERLILVREVGNPQVDPQKNVLQAAFQRLPGVESVTVSGRYPGQGGTAQTSSFRRAGQTGRDVSISLEPVGDRYFETYGMRLVAGRLFNAANRMDDALQPRTTTQEVSAEPAEGLNIILNEAASRALGFRKPSEAIGQVIRSGGASIPLTIVGVVADARFGSPREKVPPLLYYRNTASAAQLTGSPTIAVRYRGDPKAMTARLQGAWREVVPDVPFKAQTVETALGEFYEPDERRSLLVTMGTAVASLIGCLGLYGLAAFSSERRTKEIGVRKVLGASTGDVFRLLIGQFLRPVVVANLIAWPVAFVLMREWLNSFDQRIELTPAYFAAATVLALVVALATVTGQALRVARADPGAALRTE
jgi:putative ABC transport system permease protein